MVTEDKKQKKSVGAEAAANVYGNISNAANNYGIDKFSTPALHIVLGRSSLPKFPWPQSFIMPGNAIAGCCIPL